MISLFGVLVLLIGLSGVLFIEGRGEELRLHRTGMS